MSLIGREAFERFVSPRENFLNPPPVPETPIVTFTSGCTALNSSAIASVIGNTVLEPSILIVPDNSSVPSCFSSSSGMVFLRKGNQ